LNSIPRIRADRVDELPIIPGRVPDLRDLPDGCRFADRCDRRTDLCRKLSPTLAPYQNTADLVACHVPGGTEGVVNG
jgi:oligopeptide/dipeptide ABC transporter ATP-binding protein